MMWHNERVAKLIDTLQLLVIDKYRYRWERS